jgi:hypothetical protein
MTTAYQNARLLIQQVNADSVFRQQSSKEWQGPFDLPSEILDYYQQMGPVDVLIESYGNPYFLPSLAELWAFQAGYRYLTPSGEAIREWDDDWIVIADEGGDPFIFSQSSKSILFAHHGEGSWDPEIIFDCLGHMAECFAILGEIVTTNREQLTDEDSMIIPEYAESARNRVAASFGSVAKADHALMFLGWSNSKYRSQ